MAKAVPDDALSPGQRALRACLADIRRCGADSRAEALALQSVGLALAGPGAPPELRGVRWRTCAVVGNGGGLGRAELGRFIDAHDAVVRFNSMPVGGAVAATTGNKTTVRARLPQRAPPPPIDMRGGVSEAAPPRAERVAGAFSTQPTAHVCCLCLGRHPR